jgi:hypothetical protein
MKIQDFKKLEEKIKDQDFHYSYKNINIVMFILSIFGHISSIFLAFFLVSKVLMEAVEGDTYIAYGASIIMLTGLELLKREIFDKFSLQQIKLNNFFNKDVVPLFITSVIIIFMSFYASIKGAQEFSNKSERIQKESVFYNKQITDSISIGYNSKITKLEDDIQKKKDLVDKNQTDLTEKEFTKSEQKRKEKVVSDLNLTIKSIEKERTQLKYERDSLIKKEVESFNKTNNGEIASTEKNSGLFVIISIIIELTILFGVYFNEYYKWRSYTDFKSKIDKDPNYNKWVKHQSVLDIIFNDDTKVNDRVPSIKSLHDLCKVNGLLISNNEAQDIMRLFNNLGITKVSGNARYIMKVKELSDESLRKHFNIK